MPEEKFTNEQLKNYLLRVYNSYLSKTEEWRILRNRDRRNYFLEQWDDDVAKSLLAKAQKPFIMDRMRPLTKQKVALLLKNIPIGNVAAFGKDDIDKAINLNHLTRYILSISDYDSLIKDTCMALVREGIYAIRLYEDKYADYGNGELMLEGFDYEEIFLPTNSNGTSVHGHLPFILSKLYTKEEYYIKFKRMSIDDSRFHSKEWFANSRLSSVYDLKRWDGSYIDQFEGAKKTISLSDGLGVSGAVDGDWVRVYYCYSWKEKNIDVLKSNMTGMIKEIDQNDGISEEDNAALKNNLLEKTTVKELRPMLVELHGNNFVSKTELPLSLMPVSFFVNERAKDILPVGDVFFSADNQAMLNKMMTLTLYNMAMSSNPRAIADFNKLGVNATKFNKEIRQAGNVTDARSDEKGEFAYQEFKPDPIDSAHFQFALNLVEQISNSFMLFPIRIGDPSNTPNTLGATLKLDQYHDDTLIIQASDMTVAIKNLLYCIISWAPHFYKKAKTFSYSFKNKTEIASINSTFINNDPEVPEEEKQFNLEPISIEELKTRFSVILEGTQTDVEKLNQLMSQLVNVEPSLVQDLLRIQPVEGATDIADRLDREKQLQSQLKQALDVIKQLSSRIKQQSSDLVANDQSNGVS